MAVIGFNPMAIQTPLNKTNNNNTDGNNIVKNLYKFEELPNENGFFNSTYRLIGRSGQLGAIDQILKNYPHCVLGTECVHVTETTVYLELYIFFFRIVNGQVDSKDVVCFVLSVDGKYANTNDHNITFKADDFSALFYDTDNPELYFLDLSNALTLTELRGDFLEDERIFFNEKLEKVDTLKINVEDELGCNHRYIDFVKTNAPLSAEDFIKLNTEDNKSKK
jgi:hypothetical protein